MEKACGTKDLLACQLASAGGPLPEMLAQPSPSLPEALHSCMVQQASLQGGHWARTGLSAFFQ